MVNRLTYEDKNEAIIGIGDSDYKFLESVRYEDNDLSIKIGGILAFTGLISTTGIVQLSTSKNSIIHISTNDNYLIGPISFGLFFLFISAMINLFALISVGGYVGDKEKDLKTFYHYTERKAWRVECALIFAIYGSFLTLSPLFLVLWTVLY